MKDQKSESNKLDITVYEDYRDYLRERFRTEKQKRRSFSYQYCANQLRTSKNYLKLVMEKKRHISGAKISLLSKLFKLDPFEQQYFIVLFLKATSLDVQIAKYFDGILAVFRRRKAFAGSPEDFPSADEKDVVFRDWLHMAIHSLARVKGFQADATWIQDRLAGKLVSKTEIEASLQALIKNGSLKKTAATWHPDEFVMRTPHAFDHDEFRIYKIGLQRSLEIFGEIFEHRPSAFHMLTVALNEPDQDAVLALFNEFRDKVIEISKKSVNPTQVFLISNNILAVSKPHTK